MSNPITKYQPVQLNTLEDVITLGKVMAASGMFKDVKDAAQAVVKIEAGLELGIPPVVALSKIYIIEGKPSMAPELMAARIKSSGEYDYTVKKLDADGCELEFTRNGKAIGISTFAREDAEAAQLQKKDNWIKYFRNMCFARAMSNGARWYCPHLIAGAYVPEELGAAVNEDGEVIVREAATPEPAQSNPQHPRSQPPALPADPYNMEEPEPPSREAFAGLDEAEAALNKVATMDEIKCAWVRVEKAKAAGTITGEEYNTLIALGKERKDAAKGNKQEAMI